MHAKHNTTYTRTQAHVHSILVSVCFGNTKPLLSSDVTRYQFNFTSLYSIHGTWHFFVVNFISPHNEFTAHAHTHTHYHVSLAKHLFRKNLYFISSQQKVEQILIHCVTSFAFGCIRVEPKVRSRDEIVDRLKPFFFMEDNIFHIFGWTEFCEPL